MRGMFRALMNSARNSTRHNARPVPKALELGKKQGREGALEKGVVVFSRRNLSRVFEDVLMPNGRRAVMMDKYVHERALRAANAQLLATLRIKRV